MVDLETNEPLANVAITAEIREAQFLGTSPVLLERQTLRSDKNGRFTVVIGKRLRKNRGAADVSVVGALDGYATNEGNIGTRLNRSPIESETLYLLKGKTISGRILKPDGSPASGQKVKAFTLVTIPNDRAYAYPRYLETRGRADAEGRFRMIVPKIGKTDVQGEPLDSAPFKRELGTKCADIGEIRLEKGIALKGRVIDVAGKPLAHVSVGIAEYQEPFFMNLEARRTITDDQGRFVMPPMPPGTYEIAPVPDYKLVGGETRPEQLPQEDRKYLDDDGEYDIQRPLPAVFPKRKITIAAGEESPEIELKAVPHVKLVARVNDAKGARRCPRRNSRSKAGSAVKTGAAICDSITPNAAR